MRQARREDVPAVRRVRMSVRENRLVSGVITEVQIREAIETSGRGWVIEVDGEIVAFAIGNATNGNVWALFVHPDHERRGYGRRLLDTMVAWLWSRGFSGSGSQQSPTHGHGISTRRPVGASQARPTTARSA